MWEGRHVILCHCECTCLHISCAKNVLGLLESSVGYYAIKITHFFQNLDDSTSPPEPWSSVTLESGSAPQKMLSPASSTSSTTVPFLGVSWMPLLTLFHFFPLLVVLFNSCVVCELMSRLCLPNLTASPGFLGET